MPVCGVAREAIEPGVLVIVSYPLFLLVAGLGLLLGGAELLVRGAAKLALRLGVSPLLVGLTVVASGTSSPEVVVSLRAAWHGNGSIAAGNIIGSNICNIALILGVAAVIRPLAARIQLVRLDIPVMIGVSALLSLMLFDGKLGRPEAAVLAAGFAIYLWFSIRLARRADERSVAELGVPVVDPGKPRVRLDAVLIIAGLLALAAGAELFINGATRIAERVGVSQAVIALTVVAVGTSLPEFMTSIVAAARNHADLAIGNVIGSNIFNVLAILGVAGLLRPFSTVGIGAVDLGVMTGLALLMLPLARSGYRLSRREGMLLLAIYIVYVYHVLP